ncbi:MAG: sporulation integral membrane protein YlbJ [Peptococcaceae bacterium]|nr:sporulation integral membrane protein YlbJ [Peptococcaceae bacterium]
MRHVRSRIITSILAAAFIAAMIIEPQNVYDGAVMGLKTWWYIVFPALLPFFIVSELLMGLGVVHFIGVLMEPIMRPLFRLPGAASFALAIGYSSGYPIGGAVTANLRSASLCTETEAEHLIAFTNNASPLFVLVAVAVGMFHNPILGPVLLCIHYATNLTLGFIWRFYKPSTRRHSHILPNLWQRACRKFLGGDDKPAGTILSEAIRMAVNKLLIIGGFIILFAVIIKLLTTAGIIHFLAALLAVLLNPLGLSPEIYQPLASGIFEMTIGTKMVAESSAPLLHKLIAVQIILAWSGFSIQAQVAAFASGAGIRLTLYFISRIIHACLAATVTALIYPVLEPMISTPVSTEISSQPMWPDTLYVSTLLALILPFVLLSVGLCYHTARRVLLHIF